MSGLSVFSEARSGATELVESDGEDEEDLHEFRKRGLLEVLERSESICEGTPLSEALKYFRDQRRLVGGDDAAEGESRFLPWVDEEDLDMLLQEEHEQAVLKKWIHFDVIFAVAVILNGVLLGLTTQEILDEDAREVWVLEIIFFVIFAAEWCCRWFFQHQSLWRAIKDPWMRFDLFVLHVSLVDSVILGSLHVKSGASLVSTLRIVRLFRLVRLVRLIRLFKELWVLASGMLASARILAWALVMLAAVSYIFGLLLMELVDRGHSGRHPLEGRRGDGLRELEGEAQAHWGSVGRATLSMAQIATHSGAALIRRLGEELLGPWVMLVLLLFIFIASMGVVNLMVGVLLTSALQLASRSDHFDGNTARLIAHRALRSLREMLIMRCHESPGGGGGDEAAPMVSREQLLRWLIDEGPVLARSRTDRSDPDSQPFTPGSSVPSRWSSHTRKTLVRGTSKIVGNITHFFSSKSGKLSGMAGHFQNAEVTQDEINVIFNEIDSVFGAKRHISVDEFIEGCIWMKGQVHPLDLVNVLSGLDALHSRIDLMEQRIRAASGALEESSGKVVELLRTYHAPRARRRESGEELRAGTGDVEEPEEPASRRPAPFHARPAPRRVDAEESLRRHDQLLEDERARWDSFDCHFALVVALNSALLGVEVSYSPKIVRNFASPQFDSDSMAWFLADQVFFAVYCIEIGLRVIFHYQMKVMQDFRTVGGFLPKLAFVMDRPTKLQVLLSFPLWLRDTRNLLDVFILSIAAFDDFVLRAMDGSDGWSKVCSLTGLLRLLRMARLLRLVRPLTVLVRAFVAHMKLLFWSLVVLVCLIYAGAIVLVVTVGRHEATQDDPSIQRYWGHVGSAMLTLAQMVTFSGWAARVEELGAYARWVWPFMLCFLAFSSLGILNLVTGVMVQAAFRVVTGERDQRLNLQLNSAKAALEEAIGRTFERARGTVRENRDLLKEHIRRVREAVKERDEELQVSEKRMMRVPSRATQPTQPHAKCRSVRLVARHSSASLLSSPQSVVSLSQQLESDDERKDSTSRRHSVYNAGNMCILTHVTWVSCTELAVGFWLKEDGAPGPQRGPLLSAVLWEGGHGAPTVFLPDDFAAGRVTVHVGERPAHTAAARGTERPRTWLAGELIFAGLPRGVALEFRFGGNFSTVPLTPQSPPESCLDLEVSLEDLEPVDPEVLTLRDLYVLTQDAKLARRLQRVQLRPDQIVMVFQSLNVTASGRVKVTDFVDGLLRMRRPELGLDAAGAKSLMRRLMVEVERLSKDTAACCGCFTGVVQQLRGANVINMSKDPAEAWSASLESSEEARASRHAQLEEENLQLRIKVSRLQRHVEEKRGALAARTGASAEDENVSEAETQLSGCAGWD